jgi:hypothetical protein
VNFLLESQSLEVTAAKGLVYVLPAGFFLFCFFGFCFFFDGTGV